MQLNRHHQHHRRARYQFLFRILGRLQPEILQLNQQPRLDMSPSSRVLGLNLTRRDPRRPRRPSPLRPHLNISQHQPTSSLPSSSRQVTTLSISLCPHHHPSRLETKGHAPAGRSTVERLVRSTAPAQITSTSRIAGAMHARVKSTALFLTWH